MVVSRTTVAVLVGLCAGAGAGGAFLATRSTPGPRSETTMSAPLVEHSEGVLDPVVGVEPPIAPVETSRPAVTASVPPASSERPEGRRTKASARPVMSDAASRDSAATAGQERGGIVAPVEQVARAERPAADTPAVFDATPREETTPFEEAVLSPDTVIGLEMERGVSSEDARVEDAVSARVTRDVRIGSRVAIPAGSRMLGEVTDVDRGGRVRGQARLGIRFTSIVLDNGTRVPVSTDTVYREGSGQGGESAAKIGGGAIGGAILGGLLGGAKGAVIGGSVGAGAGTAAAMAGGRNAATLDAGSPVTVRLTSAATVPVEP